MGEHAHSITTTSRFRYNEIVSSENESDIDEEGEYDGDITVSQMQDIPYLVTNESFTRSEKKMTMYMEDEDDVEFDNVRILTDV